MHILKDVFMGLRRQLFVLALLTLSGQAAFAYSDFIGYGYRSCAVCHVSGAGGGMLTDYGRALYATEIAAKPFWFKGDDETLGEYSKFLGKTSLPWWVRLGYKFRQLTMERNPGSDVSKTYYYEMQNDLNMQFFFNKKQTLAFVGTLGYAQMPTQVGPNKTFNEDSYLFAREYYLKWQINRTNTLYSGLLDKTFGLRHPDHSSVSRAKAGRSLHVGQNDQVHGFMWHNANPTRDIFTHVWLGNLQAEKENRLYGGSFMYETEVATQLAVGGEALYEMNDDEKRYIVAAHVKKGFQNGNSLIGELGYTTQTSLNLDEVKRAYIFSQGHLKLSRGLYIESSGEYFKNIGESPENLQWTLGFLWFPIQRIELRAAARQIKVLNNDPSAGDSWYYLTQLHLSL